MALTGRLLIFLLASLCFLYMASIKSKLLPLTYTNRLMPVLTEDRQCLLNEVAALEAYKDKAFSLVRRRYALFSKMPLHHRQLATDVGYIERLRSVEARIASNSVIVNALARFARQKHSIRDYELRGARPAANSLVIELLHHFVRDWSQELASERNELFEPLISSLKNEFALETRPFKRVLVPGSGLGRAAYDISSLGFQTHAMEYSHLMNTAAQFIFELEGSSDGYPSQFEFYPYVHDFSHQASGDSQLRGVVSPNITSLKKPPNLSLEFGDFTELALTQSKSYDAIVSLFLIDTAENALQYLEAIHTLLKPGGIWINYGPLKWGTAPQVEFTQEELEMVISRMNFTIESKFSGSNEYNGDKMSLWTGLYKLCGWVARKNA